MYLVIIAITLMAISWFSLLASKAENRIWVKSHSNLSRWEMQQRITRGKAGLR
ncbi:MAG: hypothetical protein PVF83_04130 [Anaerolineales bacterium]|jgi:hypothetical protein